MATMTVRQNVPLDEVLRPPQGFTKVAGGVLPALSSTPRNARVRVDDVTIITEPHVSIFQVEQIALRLPGAWDGGRILATSFMFRSEIRNIPSSWSLPSIVGDNPIWEGASQFLFGRKVTTFAVPFTGQNRRVNVWRLRILHDPLTIGAGIAVLLITIAGILAFEFFSSGSISSVETTLDHLLQRSGQVASDIVGQIGPGSAVTPLLLFVAAGGIITLGFAFATRESGFNVGTLTPPSLPSPSGEVQVGPPTARVTAGVRSGGSTPRSRR